MNIGTTIQELRKRAGLTQSELAEKMNVSASHISQYERGLRNPSPSQLKRFADALGVPLNVLLASKIQDITEKSSQLDPNIINEFTFTEIEEKLLHIGLHLTRKENDMCIIENSSVKYEITQERLFELNDKCDSYLRFLLSEI